MATGGVINLDQDHPRWEEYKFERLRHPSVEDDIDKNPYPQRYDNSRTSRPRRSLIRKEGQSNVQFKGVRRKTHRYVKDLFISFLDLKWRYVVLIFFAAFFVFYGVFGVAYYFLAWLHGDFENLDNPDYVPCIENMEGAWDAFLFSVETQSTIGYGIIYAHPECGSTLPIIYLQVAAGFLFETLVFGAIFAKMARPKHRRHTLVFSRHACVLQENGQLTLQIRVGDMRRSHLIETRVRGVLIKRHVVREKYVYPLFQHQLEFDAHEMGDRLFLLWPLILTHRITETSPLWTLKPDDLVFDKFEIVVFLEGYIESTGEMCQARTSYTTREILWGHRFTRLEEYDPKNDLWVMDFVKFNQVVPSATPRCSAAELAEQRATGGGLTQSASHPELFQSNATLDDDEYDTAGSEADDSDEGYTVGQPIRIPFTPMSSDSQEV
ncbi:hypothetical protein BaRGS_00033734 [Batillaria attramentaria]|uniref:Uncharacterized protein n=1 Tax=Batillaria attramentaria TaxID=370345 RepID=A0ABD0JJV0_9CAEN